jgi:3-mercaptopropionate dioxygenase
MPESESRTQALIKRLDEAADEGCFESITTSVKDALIETVRAGEFVLSEDVLQPCENGYGRRLLHLDPDGRYSVVAMIWGEGQGTPIHDHDDMWCVECVYQGEIHVTSYEMSPSSSEDEVLFEVCKEQRACLGEAGALIPPHDHHVIENPKSETAVTIHVYGGEMNGSNVFEPIEGGQGYVKKHKSLCYSD